MSQTSPRVLRNFVDGEHRDPRPTADAATSSTPPTGAVVAPAPVLDAEPTSTRAYAAAATGLRDLARHHARASGSRRC